MILLTGATGNLGREILKELVERQVQRVCLLLRSSQTLPAQRRGDELSRLTRARISLDSASKITTVSGDLGEQNLGLAAEDRQGIIENTETIIHCAATTLLDPDPTIAEAINVRGTAQILDLARAIKRHRGQVRLVYISTAYVAGHRTDSVDADGIPSALGSRNLYEDSKLRAEMLVRAGSTEMEVRILRPSMIVGDTIRGDVCKFNVVYIPARLVAIGRLSEIPAVPEAPFDIVPVDYVARAVGAIGLASKTNELSYHLCAGSGRESSPAEMLEFLLAALNRRGRTLKRIPKFMSTVPGYRTFRQLQPFIPYMHSNPRFITERTLNEFGGEIGAAPLFRTYASTLFDRALDTDWGNHTESEMLRASCL